MSMDIESTPANFHPKTLNLQKNKIIIDTSIILLIYNLMIIKKNQYLEDQRLSA
jgi:hypothetical protein